MPITPSAYEPRPYVRNGRLAELMLRRGELEADRERRSGELSASLWQNLGNGIAGTIGGILKDRQEAPARAQAAQLRALQIRGAQQDVAAGDRAVAAEAAGRQTKSAINALLSRARKQDPVSGAWTYDRDIIGQGLSESGLSDQWMAVAPLLDQSDAAVQKLRGSQAEAIKSVAALVAATGNDPDVFESELGRGIANGLFTEQAVTGYRHAAQRDPKSIAAITRGILGKEPPALIQRDQTKDLVNPLDGAVVTAGVPEAPKADTRSLDLQLADARAKGDTAAVAAIEGAIKRGAELRRDPKQPGDAQAGWSVQTVTDPTTNQTALVRVNSRTGETQKMDLPDGLQPGGQRAPRLSAGQQDELATMATVDDLIGLTLTLGKKIGWKGVGALGTGTASQTAMNLGMSGTQDEENLRNYIANIQGTIAKLRGGTSFTPNEQKLLDSYTPTINDGDARIQAKLKSLGEFVALKRKNTMAFAGGPQPAAPTTETPEARAKRLYDSLVGPR